MIWIFTCILRITVENTTRVKLKICSIDNFNIDFHNNFSLIIINLLIDIGPILATASFIIFSFIVLLTGLIRVNPTTYGLKIALELYRQFPPTPSP